MSDIRVGDLVSFKRVGTVDRAKVEELRTQDGLFSVKQAFVRASNHEWDARWMDVDVLTLVERPKPSRSAADHEAMLAIQTLLTGVEWNADVLDEIVKVVRSAGYVIRDVNGNEQF